MTTIEQTTTRLVRTRGGAVVHTRECRYAANGAPWVWAEGLTDLQIVRAVAVVGAGVRACQHCRPLGDWS